MRVFSASVLARRAFRVLSLWLVLAQLLTLPAGAAPVLPQAQAAAPRFRAAAPAPAPTDPTPLGPPTAPPEPTSERPHATIAPAPEAGGATVARPVSLPTLFYPNLGQTDPSVRFQARSSFGSFFFTDDGMVLVTTAPITPTASAAARGVRPQHLTRRAPQTNVRLRYLGASQPTLVGTEPQPTRLSFQTDPDPARWRSDVPT